MKFWVKNVKSSHESFFFQRYPFAPDQKTGRPRPWPTCTSQVKKFVYEHVEITKDQMLKKLKKRIESGDRISLCMDEWTSLSVKKFININIFYHTTETECLGLKRARGSCPAPKLKNLLVDHLDTFGINLKTDVVCLTTDGAAIMDVIGRLIPCLHLKCQAHACNLAVCDVMYIKEKKKKKKKKKKTLESFDLENETEENETEENETEENETEETDVITPTFGSIDDEDRHEDAEVIIQLILV